MTALTRLLKLEFNSAPLRKILSFVYRPGRYYNLIFGPMKGVKLWYDRSINYHAILGLWEQDNLSLLGKVMPLLAGQSQKIQIFDIGANIGMFTIFFSRTNPAGRVYGFEPSPDTLATLQGNLEANNVKNAVSFPFAISDSDGTADFFLSHHHKSSLVEDWASSRKTTEVQKVSVRTIKLDSFVIENDIPGVDFIKIDVEGAGDRVLAGAEESINKHRPLILFESHIPQEDAAVMKLMSKFSYKAFRINNFQWVLREDADYQNPNGVWGTMLLIPTEKRQIFEKVLTRA